MTSTPFTHLAGVTFFATCCVALVACGSSPSPRPTATPQPTSAPPLRANRGSLAVIRRFLRAFIAGKPAAMTDLMTQRLRRRNRTQYVSEMLNVSGNPAGFKIVHAHTFHAKTGPWTRAVVRIELDHGAAIDRLGVVKTRAGWKLNTIKAIGAVG
jgi:hypothetical protein